jgi:hypothetical protein
MLLLTLTLEQEEYRSSGVQEFRSSGVQEFRSSGVQEFRSSGVQEFRSSGGKKNSGERCGSFAATLDELNLGATSQASKGQNPPLEKNFSGCHSDVRLESLSQGERRINPRFGSHGSRKKLGFNGG